MLLTVIHMFLDICVFDISWIFELGGYLNSYFVSYPQTSQVFPKINIIKMVFKKGDESIDQIQYYHISVQIPFIPWGSVRLLTLLCRQAKQCQRHHPTSEDTWLVSANLTDVHISIIEVGHTYEGNTLALGYFCFMNTNTSLIKWWARIGFPDRNEAPLKVLVENMEENTSISFKKYLEGHVVRKSSDLLWVFFLILSCDGLSVQGSHTLINQSTDRFDMMQWF